MPQADVPTFDTEAEAEREAKHRNDALVEAGQGFSDFWVEKKRDDGRWTVEHQQKRVPWHRRVLRGFWDTWQGHSP